MADGEGEQYRFFLNELMRCADISEVWHPSERTALLLTVHLKRADLEWLFSTIATLGTPCDITLQELGLNVYSPQIR